MAFVGTMVALVLGLLTSSAKGFYDTHNAEGVEIAANVVLLDRLFVHYGPEAKESRVLLRSMVARQVDSLHYRWCPPRHQHEQPKLQRQQTGAIVHQALRF